MADQVRFTETMRGRLSPFTGQDHLAAEAAGQDAYFILTVVTPDVAAMVSDPDHRSPAFGCVVLPGHTQPLRVTDGHLDLFVDAPVGVEMRYRLALRDADGVASTLIGIKRVQRRGWLPTVFGDTTTLFVDVLRGEEPTYRGVLRMGVGGVSAQGLSFRGEGGALGVRAIVRFMGYYVRRVWGVYARGA